METNSLLETLLWEPIKHAAIVGIQFTKMFYSWISLLLMTLISIEETPLVKGLSARSHTESMYTKNIFLKVFSKLEFQVPNTNVYQSKKYTADSKVQWRQYSCWLLLNNICRLMLLTQDLFFYVKLVPLKL